MALLSGSRLGPYEIVGALGAGGMGEVYRAKDTKLNRDVALKILPAAFTTDADRLARFKREAQVLASLNHPNIAAIYGFEDSGATLRDPQGRPEQGRGPTHASLDTARDAMSVSRMALVMELVEGEDLSAHIARGALPLADALPIAKQIADALEAAHEQGIVHRDLKPANVKVRADGMVKVLDFGLAKAMGLAGPEGAASSGGAASTAIANSPTMTSPAFTALGMILGTAAYMSPEQAKGRPVDKRADIWAFGVVLYEMLTGRRAFEGEDVSDLLVAVLSKDVAWSALPATTPASIVTLLRRCLERDPKRRLRDIGEARLILTHTDQAVSATSMTGVSPAPASFASRPALALLTVLAVACIALGWLWRQGPSSSGLQGLIRMSVALPGDHLLVAGPEISRDGKQIAFVSTDGIGRPRLYTRRLDEPDLRALPGTDEADMPFFSPDGRWIAFYARGGFFKVRVDGGDPVRLTDAASGMGGHWMNDGTIVFTKAWNSGLYRISANGGPAEPLLIPDRKTYYAYTWPFGLPGDTALLFNRWGGTAQGLMRLNLSDMSQDLIAPEQWRRSTRTTSGHIVFSAEGGDFLGIPDGPAGSAAPAPEPLMANVAGGDDPDGYTRASISESGTLVYAPLDTSQRSLVSVTRPGTMTALPGPPGSYEEIKLSNDQTRVVFSSGFKVFVHDLARGTQIPLAPEVVGSADHPMWTPGDDRIVFSANHGGTWDLYAKAASGAGGVTLLFGGRFDQYGTSILRDGTVVYSESHDVTGEDIWLLRPDGTTTPWLVTPATERMGRASPDGRLMAFNSNVSGRIEVYVRRMDGTGETVPVSTNGGTSAVWAPEGDRVYFRQGRRVMSVLVTAAPRLSVSEPEVAADASWTLGQEVSLSTYKVNYDVMRGGRLLMVRHAPESIPQRINVIFNWFDELRLKIPVK